VVLSVTHGCHVSHCRIVSRVPRVPRSHLHICSCPQP
jgi:hypothetical protein